MSKLALVSDAVPFAAMVVAGLLWIAMIAWLSASEHPFIRWSGVLLAGLTVVWSGVIAVVFVLDQITHPQPWGWTAALLFVAMTLATGIVAARGAVRQSPAGRA